MKHTVSKQLLADFAATHANLPFDSITFELDDNGRFIGLTATKTIEVDAMNVCDYDTLEELLKLANVEREAAQLKADLRSVRWDETQGLTDAQLKAVIRKFRQNPDGCDTLQTFFNRVQRYGDYVGLTWCGMFLGIEKDGYTHS